MLLEKLIFYFFAALVVGTCLVIVLGKNVLYSAFALLFTLLGVAVIYLFAKADFLAVAQVMIYAGGILILLLFGVMFTNRQQGARVLSGTRNRFMGSTFALTLFGILIYALYQTPDFMPAPENAAAPNWPETNTAQVGTLLMTDYFIPFEVTALLLLAALVGATYIAGKKQES
jgi:NADH-quinone oxidoreductase subunit J